MGQTEITYSYNIDRERLRPEDFPVLAEDRDFRRHRNIIRFQSSYIPQISVQGRYSWGPRLNFVPPTGKEPELVNLANTDLTLILRPLTQLRIDNSYTGSHAADRATGASVFNNNILRSKWNWQFNRELSLRVILQYDALLSNPDLTALPTTKNFNVDFLITYLVNPGTVLFVGYTR